MPLVKVSSFEFKNGFFEKSPFHKFDSTIMRSGDWGTRNEIREASQVFSKPGNSFWPKKNVNSEQQSIFS